MKKENSVWLRIWDDDDMELGVLIVYFDTRFIKTDKWSYCLNLDKWIYIGEL